MCASIIYYYPAHDVYICNTLFAEHESLQVVEGITFEWVLWDMHVIKTAGNLCRDRATYYFCVLFQTTDRLPVFPNHQPPGVRWYVYCRSVQATGLDQWQSEGDVPRHSTARECGYDSTLLQERWVIWPSEWNLSLFSIQQICIQLHWKTTCVSWLQCKSMKCNRPLQNRPWWFQKQPFIAVCFQQNTTAWRRMGSRRPVWCRCVLHNEKENRTQCDGSLGLGAPLPNPFCNFRQQQFLFFVPTEEMVMLVRK